MLCTLLHATRTKSRCYSLSCNKYSFHEPVVQGSSLDISIVSKIVATPQICLVYDISYTNVINKHIAFLETMMSMYTNPKLTYPGGEDIPSNGVI